MTGQDLATRGVISKSGIQYVYVSQSTPTKIGQVAAVMSSINVKVIMSSVNIKAVKGIRILSKASTGIIIRAR